MRNDDVHPIRRFLALVPCLALAIALAGCGQGEEEGRAAVEGNGAVVPAASDAPGHFHDPSNVSPALPEAMSRADATGDASDEGAAGAANAQGAAVDASASPGQAAELGTAPAGEDRPGDDSIADDPVESP